MSRRLLANFFAVVNISWAAGKAPEALEEVIASVSRQMDEQIVKERLEETISYNVSNEKKVVCAGDPAICQTSGDAVDFSAHQPRPHDDIFPTSDRRRFGRN